MSITILHGENQTASRAARTKLISELQAKGFVSRSVEGETATRSELESLLTSVSMFETEAIIIDNLISRLKSKEKAACIDLLSSTPLAKPIVMWERRALTATMLKPFAKIAEVKLFKESSSLFPFVDSLIPGNQARMLPLFHAAQRDNDIFLIFGMVVRRVTDMLIASDNPQFLAGSPWGMKQIINQSKSWTTSKLRLLHTSLLEIDLAVKTGGSKLDLTSQLDLLLLQL